MLARDEAVLAVERSRLAVPDPFRGVACTISAITDLIGLYQDAGVQLFIGSALKNDPETLELLASDIIPHFA